MILTLNKAEDRLSQRFVLDKNGVIYSKDAVKLIDGTYVQKTDITVNSRCRYICDCAFFGGEFSNCGELLKSVRIHEGLLEIRQEAFYGCKKLKTINLPASLVSVSKSAFEGCTSLKSIFIPKGTRAKFEALLGKEYHGLLTESEDAGVLKILYAARLDYDKKEKV